MTQPRPEPNNVPGATAAYVSDNSYGGSTAYADTTPDVSNASVGELVGHVAQDLSMLMRQELELAKAEVKQEITKTGKAAGMFGAAGFAGYMVLLFASIALWWGLANVMDQGWAALIVTAIWAVIGAVAFVVGRRQIKEVNPKPEQTIETVKELPDTLKGART
jgi:Putative Actinobacterial Holin-X, holin superfamily III